MLCPIFTPNRLLIYETKRENKKKIPEKRKRKK